MDEDVWADEADLPQTVSGRRVRYFVAVVCTDRGQHERVQLSLARKELDGSFGMSHALEYFAPPTPDGRWGKRTSRTSYQFWCPRCRRTPRVERTRWWDLVEAVGRGGLPDLDVSLLPF